MSDKTGIEWTNATKRCSQCQTDKPAADFARDKSRPDGLTYVCRECRNARSRTSYERKNNPGPFGPAPAPARDGDERQARKRVNQLVMWGRLPHPNSLPCADCGHRYAEGERRHEYDHHLGYAAEHHLSVQAVCTTCHHARERARRKAA